MSIQNVLNADWSRGVPNLQNQVDGNNENNLKDILGKINELPSPAKLKLKEKCWKFIDSRKDSAEKAKLGQIASQFFQINNHPKALRDKIKQVIPNINFKKLTENDLILLNQYVSKEPIEKHNLGRLYFILKESKSDTSFIKDKLLNAYLELPEKPSREEFESLVAHMHLKGTTDPKFLDFLKQKSTLKDAVYGYKLLLREGLISKEDVYQALAAKSGLAEIIHDKEITDNVIFKLFHLEAGQDADFLPDPKLTKKEWILLISHYGNLSQFPLAKMAILKEADAVIDRLETTRREDLLVALLLHETFVHVDNNLSEKIGTSINQGISRLREHNFLEKIIGKLLSFLNPAFSYFLRVDRAFLFDFLKKAHDLNLVIPDNVSPEDFKRFMSLNLKGVSLPNNLTQEQFNSLPHNLESIDLSRCTQLTDLNRLDQMKDLKAKKLPLVKNIDPQIIIKQCTTNGVIDLSRVPQDLKPEQYDAIIEAIPLDTFSLDLGMIPVSAKALKHIMKLKNLDELTVNLEHIDDSLMLEFLLFLRDEEVEISSLVLIKAKLNPENASVLLYECDCMELNLIDSTFEKGKKRLLTESKMKIQSLILNGCLFKSNPFIDSIDNIVLKLEDCKAEEPIILSAHNSRVEFDNNQNMTLR